VLNDFSVDTRQIEGGPGENVTVVSKELDKLVSLFLRELRANYYDAFGPFGVKLMPVGLACVLVHHIGAPLGK
jgi:hypothetical protein